MNKVCGVLHSRVTTDSGNRQCYENSRRRDFGHLHQKRKKEAKSKLHIQLIVTVVFLVFPVLKTKEETKDKCLKC